MTLTRRIISHLTEHGPASCPTLSDQLDAPSGTVSRLLTRLCGERKQLYIIRYERGSPGELRRARAVYAVGNKKNASRPKPDERGKKQRWYAKRKALSTMNSVFNLGIPATNWTASCKFSNSLASQA